MIKADNDINIHETFSPVHIKSKMHQIRNQVCCVSLGNGKFLILTPLSRILHCESSRAGIKRSNLSTTPKETQNQHIRCFRVFEQEYKLNRKEGEESWLLQNGRIQLLQRLHCSVRARGKNSNSFFRNLFRILPAFSIQYYINIDMWLLRFCLSSEKYLDLTCLLCASLLHTGDPLRICPERGKRVFNGMAEHMEIHWAYMPWKKKTCFNWDGMKAYLHIMKWNEVVGVSTTLATCKFTN